MFIDRGALRRLIVKCFDSSSYSRLMHPTIFFKQNILIPINKVIHMVTILEKNSEDAKSFLLKEESYKGIPLPTYFSFEKIILSVDSILEDSSLASICKKPRDFENVNYKFFCNKDGRFSWRPLELIHPAIYVEMTRIITSEENWSNILRAFTSFGEIKELISCASIPKEAEETERSDIEENILGWWDNLEQESLRLALDYEYVFHTDIADCYSSIYTHSISWALHTKNEAKANRRKKSLIGNIIDGYIQDMCHCQTNGIPQGSVLMDFVAEMVLGYADLELYRKLESQGISSGYKILRYRDDYRIFTNSPEIGETVLKNLTEVLLDLSLKLNSRKTKTSSNIVRDSIKSDKIYWLNVPEQFKGFQKEVLLIHQLSLEHPNSGGVVKALGRFLKRLEAAIKLGRFMEDPTVIASIVVDIGLKNPRTYPMMTAVLSHLLNCLSLESEQKILDSIVGKFSRIPNTSYLDVWLQRMILKKNISLNLRDPLCGLIDGSSNFHDIWNSEWVNSKKLNAALNEPMVDREELEKLPTTIKREEVSLFAYRD